MNLISPVISGGVTRPSERLPIGLDVSYYDGSDFLCYTFADSIVKQGHQNWLLPQERSNPDLSNANNAQCVIDTDGVIYKSIWSDIEPSIGVYDFSAITSALDYCNERGKKLILRFFWKTYVDPNDPPNSPPVPNYILTDHIQYGGVSGAGGLYKNYAGSSHAGWSARLDNIGVMARAKALITALASEISFHPCFSGFMFDESNWSVYNGSSMPAGLSTETIVAADKDIYLHAQAEFAGHRVFPNVNFVDGHPYSAALQPARDLLEWTIDNGFPVGVTDTFRIPEKASGIQPVYKNLPKDVFTIVHVDYLSTGDDDSGLTQRMIQNARQAARLGADITVWYNRGGASSNYWTAIKNAIAQIG